MIDFLKKMTGRSDPEAMENLLHIEPTRRYTRAEIVSLLPLLSGIVVDGIAIQGFSEIKEDLYWYSVDVDYGATYEAWYFFKAEE